MPRNRTHPPAPDLFSEATPRDAFPAPVNQVPSPKPAIDKPAANSLHRYVLPKDLPGALKQLDDRELASLLAAAFDEAKRRDRLPPGLEVTSAAGKPLPKSKQGSNAPQGHSAAISLTRGQVNAVRAAFKAGIGPSRIAREHAQPALPAGILCLYKVTSRGNLAEREPGSAEMVSLSQARSASSAL
jgi:hypothetical protein